MTIGVSPVSAHGVVDQKYEGPFSAAACSSIPTSFGQTFTPTVSNLVAVDLFLLDRGPAGNVTVMNVVIKEGDPSGPILGSSSLPINSTGDINFPTEREEHIDFPAAIPITPGNKYFIGVEFTNCNTFLIRGNFFDAYLGGSAVGIGPLADFGFRTYFSEGVVVGGEILGVDISLLFVAGAFTNIRWILPVVGLLAGIVAFVLRKTIK